MAAKVALYSSERASNGAATCHIRKRQADYLLAHGYATKVRRGAIALLPSGRLKCGQGEVYEAAAIDMAPRFCQGGLARTEHQPAEIPRYKAARVGHG